MSRPLSRTGETSTLHQLQAHRGRKCWARGGLLQESSKIVRSPRPIVSIPEPEWSGSLHGYPLRIQSTPKMDTANILSPGELFHLRRLVRPAMYRSDWRIRSPKSRLQFPIWSEGWVNFHFRKNSFLLLTSPQTINPQCYLRIRNKMRIASICRELHLDGRATTSAECHAPDLFRFAENPMSRHNV